MLHSNKTKDNHSIRAGFYARVSSDQQANAGTIDSQISALEQRAVADQLTIDPAMRFIDEGHSGSTLVRPALERLRDIASDDGIDRLYVLCPDRLARKHSYQMLLIDEFERCDVQVVFLDHASRDTPEDRLLVQVQGVVAEYERAKIMERCRRGKLHLARRGAINVLGGAPYGYRYVPATAGVAAAQYTIQLQHAAVVRDLFQWIGSERQSIRQACKRLENKGILSPRGHQRWDRSTVWGILKNPAYKGSAAFGKTQLGPMRPRLRGARGRPDLPRDGQSVHDQPPEQWISIPVPAIVDADLFDAVAEQLKENQKRSRQRLATARHLLQGLAVCTCCGYAFYAKGSRTAHGRVYYRCTGSEANRFGGQRVCDNKPLREETLDQTVWNDVRALLADPKRIEEEMNRRLKNGDEAENDSSKKLKSQIAKLNRGIARLTDAYRDELLERGDFESRIKSMRDQIAQLQTELQAQADQRQRTREIRGIVDNLEKFSCQVNGGLENATWETKRELIRTLVKRIEIDKKEIKLVYRVELSPFDHGPQRGPWHYCWRSVGPTATRG